MPVFEYKAFDINGKTVPGIIEADNPVTARQKLRTQKIYPVSVNEAYGSRTKKNLRTYVSRPFSRVRPDDITIMTRQLSTLVGAGFPLVSAFDALIPQTGSDQLKKSLAKIKDSIVEGKSFANALSLYPGLFPSFYINMVQAGETSGTLEIVLDHLAVITEKQQDLKNRIKAALTYPIFMALLCSGVLFFLLTYIVPTIVGIFTDMDQVLPAPTLLLVGFSSFIKSYWWALLVFLGILLTAIGYFKKTETGQRFIHKSMFTLPFLGPLIRKLAVARFSRTLGSLLENGVSMLTAMDIVKNIVGNVLISNAVEKASGEVGKGQGLGVSLDEDKVFPDLSIQMIQVGEQSGELEPMLYKIADVYEKEAAASILKMTSMLEPVMILVMGGIVLFIVLSVCLPILNMNRMLM
ncbi:MAG: type II secretion system inner membrane protein GspF [Desulfobacterales bacterium]|nr:type II secretion system inner membrane protein GspF [Desulfobacterales bacterium]